jgi:hypothetical protein
MSTKLHFLPANPVDYWTLGIRGLIFDRDNYRIIPRASLQATLTMPD